MKKYIVFIFVLVLLVGCSSGAKSEGKNQGSSEDKVLNVAVQKHSAVEALEELLPKYEEETGVKVKFDTLPQNELKNKTELAMASSTGEYDVIMYDYVLNSQYAKAGWVTDLSEYIDNNDVDTDEFFPGFLDSFKYEDKQFAFPFFGESLILMYNKEIFEEAGIDNPPKTMEELKTTSEKIKNAGFDAIAMRGARGEGMNVFIWSSFFQSFGGKWFDQDGKPTINSQESVEATELYADLLNNYGPNGAQNFTWDQVQLSMQQGSVGMVIDSLNFAPRLENEENSNVVGKVGYAMIPEGPEELITGLGTWGMAIPSGSEDEKAAFDFINWATSEEIQLETSLNGDRADATRSAVWDDPEYQKKHDYVDWAEVAKTSMDKAVKDYRPGVPEWRNLGDSVSIAISETLSGNNAKDSLDKAQKDAEELFED